MQGGRGRLVLVLAVVIVAAGVAVKWRATARRTGTTPSRPAAAAGRDRTARTETARPPEGAEPDPLFGDEQATLWARVDLAALRAELPDNLYWTMAVPTKDPAVLDAREAERARWNAEYGKVLSNTATADEIDAYYAHRYQLSADYVQFATYLLADYGDHLPPRDVALLKLAIEMHLARLEEIPRQIAEANERREAHDAVRRAWLEDQKAFASGPPDAR